MKTFLLFAILLLTPGCASQQVDHILSNLDKDCERHYMGNLGAMGVGATVSFQIDCKASGTTTTTTTTFVPANPSSGAVPSGQ